MTNDSKVDETYSDCLTIKAPQTAQTGNGFFRQRKQHNRRSVAFRSYDQKSSSSLSLGINN